MEDTGNRGVVAMIVAVATIGGLLFGYDSGAVNGTQDGLKTAFALSDAGLGFTVGSLLIGCFIGAFLAGRLADLLGRRKVMMLAAVAFLAGALVQGFAHAHWLFVLARIFGGMAVGAASVLSPAYISEVAPAEIRGRLATMQQVMIITGLTAAFVVNYLLAQAAGASTNSFWGGIEAWRWMYLMQAAARRRSSSSRCCSFPRARAISCPRAATEAAAGVLRSLFGGGRRRKLARDPRQLQR